MTPDATAILTAIVCLIVLASMAMTTPECDDAGCRRAHQAHQPKVDE